MTLSYSNDTFSAFLLAGIPAIISLVLAAYVYFKMPQRLLTRLFVVDLIFTMGWQAGSAMSRISGDAITAEFWDKMLEPLGLLCAPLILHFSVLFTQKEENRNNKDIIYAAYLVTFLLALTYPVFSLPDHFVYDHFWGWVNIRKESIYSNILGIVLQVQYFATIIILGKAFLRSKKKSDKYYQLLLIDICLIIIIIQAFITEGILPNIFHLNFPVTSTVIAVYPISVFVALTRFRLFKGFEVIEKHELLASISDIVIVINQDLKITYMNKAGLDQLDHDLEKIEGQIITSFLDVSGDQKGDFMSEIILPILDRKAVRNVKCLLHPPGKISTPVLLSSDILQTSSKAEGYLLVCRSISDLEEARIAIKKNSAYLEQLFAASPFAITILNNEGRVLSANPAFEKIFQYHPSEITDSVLSEIITPEAFRKEALQQFAKVALGHIVTYESIGLTKSNNSVNVYVIGYPVIIDEIVEACYFLYLDISAQKASEKEIILKNEELVKINLELDHFFYSASHDIRAPLRTVLGIINLYEMEAKDKNAKMYFKMIKDSILKLDSFTLDLIRHSNNLRTEILAQEFDVSSLIKNIIDGFVQDNAIDDFHFELDVRDVLMFTTDRQRLNDIVYQLVKNAITYRKDEIGHKIMIRADINKDRHLILHVADNGTGIEKKYHEQIFGMFSRLSEKSNGSGLGLYIVNEIVNKLKGKIEIDSEPGRGSVFMVTIPGLMSVEK